MEARVFERKGEKQGGSVKNTKKGKSEIFTWLCEVAVVQKDGRRDNS